METSLHRQLKQHYAIGDARQEVVTAAYRIDVVRGNELVEIQHGSLSAIRDKIKRLVEDHQVLVVKPIVLRKRIIKLDKKDGRVIQRRMSPSTGSLLELFDELIYFTRVFPHPNLTLEVPLVEIEEWRFPGHGRRRRRRRDDHQVADQKLIAIHSVQRYSTAADLLSLLPANLPQPFHTGDLAGALKIRRWVAQRIAYCLRKMGAVDEAGKQRNALLYAFRQTPPRRRKKAA